MKVSIKNYIKKFSTKSREKESSSLRTKDNIYSTYVCGQEVMAQRFRMKDPSNTTYCIGVINRVISNSYYEIKFRDNSTQILKKSYFYVANRKNQEEYNNFLSKRNEIYGPGKTVKVNKNYYKNIPPNYVSGTVIYPTYGNFERRYEGAYFGGNFSIQLENGDKLYGVPMSAILTACDNYSEPETSPKEQEEEEETIDEISSPCQNKKTFSTHLFVMQNKKILGIIQIVLTLVTFLIIIYKIFPFLSQYESRLLMAKNISMTLISIGTIFLAIILINKQTINLMNFLILISIFFLIIIFTYVYQNKKSFFLFDSFQKIEQGKSLTDFDMFCQGVWSVIFPISMGPFYLLGYFLIFIPTLVINRLGILDKYKLDFTNVFYGKVPDFLGSNKALYVVIIASFFVLYLYLITYFFDGYVDVSNKKTQNNLTSEPLVQLKKVGKGILSLSKKYIYEILFILIIIGGIILNSIFQIIAISLLRLIFVILITYLIFYFIVRISIPYLYNSFNPSVSLKEFDNKTNSFKVEILDLNYNVVGTKNVLPENIGKQIKINNIKIMDYDKSTKKFKLKIFTSPGESKIVNVRDINLKKYLTPNISLDVSPNISPNVSNFFKVKKYVKDLKGFKISNELAYKKTSKQIIIDTLLITFIIIFIVFIFTMIITVAMGESYKKFIDDHLEKDISEDIVSSITFY